MELVFIRSSVAVSIIVISLTLLILGSVTYQTIARPGTRGASSNCNSCHSSSYYLTVDIRSVDAPSSLLKGSSGWINVTVDVSASHESSLWSGFSMDVWLSSSGKIDTGSHQILTGLSPSGSSPPYSWSDTFEFQVSAISAGMDTVTAYAKMDPVHYSPPVTDSQKVQVEIPNNSPILDSGLVTPVSGYSDGTFSFSVNYLDLDGDLPSSINVFIDSILYAMSDLPGGDGSVKDGELFGVSGIYLDEGSHSFHFEASDGIEQTRFPASGEQNGPEVLHRNLPPELDVGRVSPSVGTPGDIFTFTVIYTDPEDDAPDPGVLVSIDGENNWTLMERDAEETGHLGDGSFDNGETFSVSIPLGVGRHIYRFNCSDGELTSTLGPIYGPDVDETAIIVSVIEEPENGSTHLSNGSIRLSGSFSSNVEVQDAEALWRSNISGVIGSGWSFNTRLEYGSHRLFFKVTSALEGMSHESHVDILVKDPVVAPEVDLVRESSPEGDVVIEETENVTFSISLDPDHPMILEDANLVVTWYLDDLVRTSGTLNWTFRSSYLDSGGSLVKVEISNAGMVIDERVWNLTILDVPAPILETGSMDPNLGSYQQGDTIHVALLLVDAAGRDLSVFWTVDDELISGNSLVLDLEIMNGTLGTHILKAKVSNPDGVEMGLELNFNVIQKITGNDDDDEQIDEDTSDPVGVIILAFGFIALVGGIAYSIYALAGPMTKSSSKDEDWEDEQ